MEEISESFVNNKDITSKGHCDLDGDENEQNAFLIKLKVNMLQVNTCKQIPYILIQLDLKLLPQNIQYVCFK